MSEQTYCVLVMWGSVDMRGNWYPNPHLSMSADEQRRQNIANGTMPVYRPPVSPVVSTFEVANG